MFLEGRILPCTKAIRRSNEQSGYEARKNHDSQLCAHAQPTFERPLKFIARGHTLEGVLVVT